MVRLSFAPETSSPLSLGMLISNNTTKGSVARIAIAEVAAAIEKIERLGAIADYDNFVCNTILCKGPSLQFQIVFVVIGQQNVPEIVHFCLVIGNEK